MLIGLYTSRVILNALGVQDYGIYNVVGGFVAMFALISGTLSSSISRFLTFELGRGDFYQVKKVFSTGLTLQLGLCIVVILLGETIGLWFLNAKIQIPNGRYNAAFWVYQLSILTFCLNLISVPYNATIIAHEKMTAFAYIGIIEGCLKLLIAFAITISPFDKLISYSILMALVALIVRSVYTIYCQKTFNESKYNWTIDKGLFKEMFIFAGWNFIGSSSSVLMGQGVNILMNMFFGIIPNAARGIATTVENIVNQFANSFVTAISPQITKSYASHDLSYMHSLVFKGSKFSFYLVFILALPLLLETESLLSIWLGKVPEYTISFIRLTISISLLSVLSNTLVTSILATGNTRNYQIIVGGLGLLIFPLAYISYLAGFSPEFSYIIQFIIFVFQLGVRLYLLKQMISLSIIQFMHEVLFYVFIVLLTASILPVMAHVIIQDSTLRFIIVVLLCILSSCMSIYFLGFTRVEREVVAAKVLSYIKR